MLRLRAISLLDQIMFSAGNFLLTIILVKNFPDQAVVGYGVGLSVALLLQNIFWNIYVIKNSILPEKLFIHRAESILGQHLIIFALIISLEVIGCLFYMFIWPSELAAYVSLSIVMCTLIYLQLDFERITCLKFKKNNVLFFSSFIFMIITALLFFILPVIKIPYVFVILAIMLYSIVKILHLIQVVGKVNFKAGLKLVKLDFRRSARSSLLGASGGFGYSHLPIFLMSKFAAPLEAAAFIALRGLMQPIMIVIRSLDVIDKNFFSKLDRTEFGIRKIFLRQLPIYLTGSGGIVFLTVFFGKDILSLIYGDKYEDYSHLLIGWSLAFALLMVTPPLDTIIIRLKRNQKYNYIRMWSGIIAGLLSLYICPIYGAVGALGIAILGYIIVLIGGLWIVRDVLFAPIDRKNHKIEENVQ